MHKIPEIKEIIECSWYTGNYSDDSQTKFCLVGAIGKAYDTYLFGGTNENVGMGWNTPEADAIKKVIFEHYRERSVRPEYDISQYQDVHIPWFNDHPDTTLEDIIAVLEKAQVLLDEQIEV